MQLTSAHRLATYGTLAPGRANYHHVAMLGGTWATGTVTGHLRPAGWGAAMGYPGMVPDRAGPEIAVHVLTSPDLPAHWARLDAFEGPGYRRIVLPVRTADSVIEASIYALAEG
ncbi:MAG: gamma-glutamylcyclotransferase [Pseudomonadota bacterium]